MRAGVSHCSRAKVAPSPALSFKEMALQWFSAVLIWYNSTCLERARSQVWKCSMEEIFGRIFQVNQWQCGDSSQSVFKLLFCFREFQNVGCLTHIPSFCYRIQQRSMANIKTITKNNSHKFSLVVCILSYSIYTLVCNHLNSTEWLFHVIWTLSY